MHSFRFYLPPELIKKSTVKITGADAHHAVNVLRLKAGESLIIFDGLALEYTAEILSISKNELILSNLKEIRRQKKLKPLIELFASLIPKFDDVVETATELGVSRIFPMITNRTPIKIPVGSFQKKMERWKRIAISASMQSGRIILPEIYEPLRFNDAIKQLKSGGLQLIASLAEDANSILDVLNGTKPDLEKISIYIGPPADFSEEELSQAKKSGIFPVKLVPNTLRSETAVLSALAVISSFFYTRSSS